MSKNWTDKQKQAIELRDKTILVSAAAGSGKTATLTERIVRKLTDESNPASISKMLIVTFTRLSAADLKRKISNAISDELAKNPTSQYLSKQLIFLAKECHLTLICKTEVGWKSKALEICAHYIEVERVNGANACAFK